MHPFQIKKKKKNHHHNNQGIEKSGALSQTYLSPALTGTGPLSPQVLSWSQHPLVFCVHICSPPYLLPKPHFLESIILATEGDLLSINKNCVSCRMHSWGDMAPCRDIYCMRDRQSNPLNIASWGQKSKMPLPMTCWFTLWIRTQRLAMNFSKWDSWPIWAESAVVHVKMQILGPLRLWVSFSPVCCQCTF